MNLISITGPESTGKSSLSRSLAAHYGALWVREYAREYLAALGRAYVYEDIARIAKEQLRREEAMAQKSESYLFCDTDPLVCKIWSRFKYGKSDPWIDAAVESHRYDLYLLCDIDLPWVEDPFREHPDRRKELFDLYFCELKSLGARLEVISGQGRARLDHAISIIDKAFTDQRSSHE